MGEQEIMEGLRQVVMDCWDPLGVAHVSDAADEYDAYLPWIQAKLVIGDQVGLESYLSDLRTRMMGSVSKQTADEEAAQRIFAWHQASIKDTARD